MKSGYFAPIVSEELMEEMNKTFRNVCKTCKISIKEAIELCGYRRQSFYKALKTKKFPRALFLAMMEGMFVIIDFTFQRTKTWNQLTPSINALHYKYVDELRSHVPVVERQTLRT